MRTRITIGGGPSGDVHEIVQTTQADLRALRDAGGLEMNKIYKFPVDDVDGNGVVCMTPLDESTLPSNAHWEHPTLTAGSAWPTDYDIDTGLMEKLHDTVNNNIVYSHESINAFPFGNANVNENEVHSRSQIFYTSGTMARNTIGNNSSVTVEGILRDSTVGNESNVVAQGTVERTIVKSNASLNVAAGASVNDTEIGNESNLVVNGGSVGDTTIAEDASVTFISGSNIENHFGTSVVYTQVGTGFIRYSKVEGNTTVTNGNVNISNSRLSFANLNTTGSTGSISQSDLQNVLGVRLQNIPSLTINQTNMEGRVELVATGAARLYIIYGEYTSGARVIVSAGARLDSSYDELSSFGYLQVTQGTLFSTFNTVSDRSYIQHASPNLNRASRVHISAESRVRFLNTVNDCRIYYTSVDGGAICEHRGTSTGCYIYYSTVHSRGQIYTSNSVNARMYYNDASSNGQVYSISCTATHYIYYSTADSFGRLGQRNNSADTRIYAGHADSIALLELRNTAVGIARVYYSSVHAYYYLYITKTVGNTTSALHGYGRRSFFVTDPANGTFTQNF